VRDPSPTPTLADDLGRQTVPATLARVLLGTLAASLAATLGAGSPRAQEAAPTSAEGRAFSITPYLWAASLDGKVGVGGLRTVDVDEDFDDILSNLDVALTLFLDGRVGRFGLFADVDYLGLSADGDPPRGVLFDDVDVDIDALNTSLYGYYRVLGGGRAALDALAGGRLWYVRTEIDLSGNLLRGRQADASETWADPVVGARGEVELGAGFHLFGLADVGGFGVSSDSTWQLMGALGYRFGDRIVARAGYRHLEVDYDDGGFVYDVDLSGPILGVTFRF
jgi:hypothetical protein